MSLFAIPGLIVFLPFAGAVSDAIGKQASILALVPVSLAAGAILASASGFVADDIEAVRVESLARVVGAVPDGPRDERNAAGRSPGGATAGVGKSRPLEAAVASAMEFNGEEGGRYG